MIEIKAQNTNLRFSYWKDGQEHRFSDLRKINNGFVLKDDQITLKIELQNAQINDGLEIKEGVLLKKTFFNGSLKSNFPTRVKIEAEVGKGYNIIPCNIFGDNNYRLIEEAAFPHLTQEKSKSVFVSDYWEFNANRASHPVSICVKQEGIYGIYINPENIPAGVSADIEGRIGVELGYRNTPILFLNKSEYKEGSEEMISKCAFNGIVYFSQNPLGVYDIIRDIYEIHRKKAPQYALALSEYRAGILNAMRTSYDDNKGVFSDIEFVPEIVNESKGKTKVFRDCWEIGWTGGANLYFPLLQGSILAKEENQVHNYFDFSDMAVEWFDKLSDRYNPKSGFLFDLEKRVEVSGWNAETNDVNGWWAGYVVKNCHCAYTNGTAIHYLLKAYSLFLQRGDKKEKWLEIAQKVLDTVCELQCEDGNLGYGYSIDKKRMIYKDGFAGCWFCVGLAQLYILTGNKKYLECCEKAMGYYYNFLIDYNVYGTPMDTKWSVDEEGNLAFLKACVLLNKCTGNKDYLEKAVLSANYEYLWRYAHKGHALYSPLKDNYNAIGGSVTSVSNPHIHPMACIACEDLMYLYQCTKDEYHKDRCIDGISNFLAGMDIWSKSITHREVGFMSERFCPSDGFTTQKYLNGESASVWFVHNCWAVCAVLDGLNQLSTMDEIK